MKQIIFTVLVLAIPFLVIGQSPSIQWLEVSNERGKNNQSIVGHSEKHYYILNGSKKKQVILQYDFNHQLLQSTSLKDLGSGDKLEAYQIVSTPSSNHLFFLSQTKKEIIFYASKIKDDGSIDTNVQRVFSSPVKNKLIGNKKKEYAQKKPMPFGAVMEEKKEKDAVGMFQSQNAKMVLYANTKHKQKGASKEKKAYHIVVMNENMESIWEREIEFSFSNKRMIVKQIEVSNSGEVYILASIKIKKNRKGILPKSDFAIYKVNQNNELEPIIPEVKDVFPSHAMMYLPSDGGLHIGGFFTKKGTKKLLRQHGVFMMKYDDSGAALFEKTHFWSDDFFAQLKAFKIKKRGKGSLNASDYDLRIGDIHVDEKNGSISFVTEYLRFTRNGANGESNSSRHLIIPSFSFDGEHRWTTCINKINTSSTSGMPSKDYFSFQKNGNIYLIFDDQKTSKELKNIKLKGKQTADFTDMIQLNSDGATVFQETIFNSKEAKVSFQPESSSYLGNGVVLLDGGGIKQRRVGVLKLH